MNREFLKTAIMMLSLLATNLVYGQSLPDLNTCPTPKYWQDKWEENNRISKRTYFSRAEMYKPMQPGTSESYGDIVFLDKNDWGNRAVIENYPELNKQLFTSATQKKSSEKYSDDGIFKIGYRYRATECRRQIILGYHMKVKKKPTGKWYGWTAIDICNPGVMKLFALAKGNLGAGKMPTVDHFLGFVNKLPVGTNPGELDPNLRAQLNAGLAFTSKAQRENVTYFKDKNGDIVPRFAVKTKEFYYDQYKNECEMVIKHGTSYAGLASSYTWPIKMEDREQADSTIWYWALPTGDYPNKTEHAESKGYVYQDTVDNPGNPDNF